MNVVKFWVNSFFLFICKKYQKVLCIINLWIDFYFNHLIDNLKSLKKNENSRVKNCISIEYLERWIQIYSMYIQKDQKKKAFMIPKEKL